jgi:hypothetical protein
MGLLRLTLSKYSRRLRRPVAAICATRKRFRAEGLGGALVGVDAEPFDGGAHHDDAGHADDHAQQGEEAAQLVRADGIHRQPNAF